MKTNHKKSSDIKCLSIVVLSSCLLSARADAQTSATPATVSSPPTSFAASNCGRNFSVSGDPRNGSTYVTFVKFANLDIRSAIGQIEKIAIDQGMQVGADQFDGGSGRATLIIKDPSGGGDYPMVASAQKSTEIVGLAAKLNRGQIVSKDAMRDKMCGMLFRVRMDAAGASIAESTRKNLGSGEITDIKAIDLALEVAEALKSKQDASQVTMKYYGKTYRIDGQVSSAADIYGGFGVSKIVTTTKSFDLPFITEVHGGLLGIGPMHSTPVQIECQTAPDQLQQFLNLQTGDYATLIGKVTRFVGKGRPKSILNDNPLNNTAGIFSNQSYGGTLYLECRFGK